MNEQRRNFIVGSFVLIAVIALLAITLLLRGGLRTNDTYLKTSFSQVSGLEVGAPVLVAGVNAGRVVAIRKWDQDPPILVEMRLSNRMPVRVDAKARIVSQGFIGDKRIEISPGSTERALVIDGSYIESVEPYDMERTIGEAQQIVREVRESVTSLRELLTAVENREAIEGSLRGMNESITVVARLLKDNEASLDTALGNLGALSERSLALVETTEKAVARADESIAQVTASANESIQSFNTAIGTLQGDVQRVLAALEEREKTLGAKAESFIDGAGAQLDQLAKSLTQTSDELRGLLERVDRGDGTLGLLLNDPKPFRALAESLDAVRNVVLGRQQRLYDTRIDYAMPAGS